MFTIYEIFKAISSRNAPLFNERYKNKSLTNILAFFGFCMILCGALTIIDIPFIFKYLSILICIAILGIMNGTAQILGKKYLNSFTNAKILTCIYSAKSVSDNLSKMIITAIGSFVLTFVNINVAFIIVGFGILIITFILSIYMNGRVGLDPEEYTQKDIYIRK